MRTRRLLLLTGLVVYGGSAALIAAVHPILTRTHMLALDVAYLLFLATSLWMAWGTLIRRSFADRNAWYIAIGMTCFYFCDVTVGLSAALKGNALRRRAQQPRRPLLLPGARAAGLQRLLLAGAGSQRVGPQRAPRASRIRDSVFWNATSAMASSRPRSSSPSQRGAAPDRPSVIRQGVTVSLAA